MQNGSSRYQTSHRQMAAGRHRQVAIRHFLLAISNPPSATKAILQGGSLFRGKANHGYILEDLSGKYSPTEWAQKAIAAYKRHRADRIVAEANQGGALVEATLRACDRSVPIRLVHASRGKITRAEPISAFYEQPSDR
jgi:phage terminase large subunit-like protein